MNVNNYILDIKLTNFLDSRIIESEDGDGHIERGVFIPLLKNGLHVDNRNNVIFSAFVNEKQTYSADGYTHTAILKSPKSFIEKLKSLGFQTMYLGRMRPNIFQKQNVKVQKSIIERVKERELWKK